MNETWHTRVQTYVDELEQTAKTIDTILTQTRVDTTEVSAAGVEQSLGPLQAALIELEEKIAQREALLRDSDAPVRGLSLTEKLRGTLEIEDERLARRCEAVANLMANAHQRAVSLFVCQYHLADFSTEIVRLLTGSDMPSTYQSPTSEQSGRGKPDVGGGLFNEAA